MGTRVDDLIEEMKSEEQQQEQSKGQQETPPEEPKAPEEKPPEEKPQDTPPEETSPSGGDEEHEETDKGGKPDDALSRAEFSFRRQLGKQKEKHEKELAARDAKYAELEKKFNELEKRLTPKPALKTREDFRQGDGGDEEFVQYLAEERVKQLLAERDEKDSERRAKEEEEAKKREQENAELEEQQRAWLSNVDKAFGSDKERAKTFLTKIQYANKNGLGEILDNCPVAADFLMNDPSGPKVFEKMLDDRETFVRVFPQGRPLSPIGIFYELKNIEKELSAGAVATPPQGAGTPAKPKMPSIGKPGKQAGGNSKPDVFEDREAMRDFIRR